jgi:S-DNA-T family DNA segregation ATPase FtsK/SpoIIIE
LTPVITEAKKAILALKWAAREMDRRYDLLEKCKVRDISSYHENIVEPAHKKGGENMPELMPYIVFVIDELADIMQTYPKELEAGIVRLAQMSRAVGIHLILSTQRPSVNVITGLIKANVPSRLALQVASQIDSRTILDMPGAEKLLGAGDMLFLSGDVGQPSRVQSAFITETEVKGVVDYLINQYRNEVPQVEIDFKAEQEKGNAAFGNLTGNGYEEDDGDDLYEDAKQAVVEAGKASTSYIQRKLRVGYARAARLIDMLEERGVVGPADGSRPREILAGGDDGSRGDEYPDTDVLDNNEDDSDNDKDSNSYDNDNSSYKKYENS